MLKSSGEGLKSSDTLPTNIGNVSIVFLDVDGVLNYFRTKEKQPGGSCLGIDPTNLKQLKRILTATGAYVVLSSSWRHYNALVEYFKAQLDMPDRWLGQTGCDMYRRGREIEAWLKQYNKPVNYVILDDDSDMDPLTDHTIQTSFKAGLTEALADKAIAFLLTQKNS